MLKRLSCLVLIMISSYTAAYTPTRSDLRQAKLMIASMHEDIRIDGELPTQREKDLSRLYDDAPSAQRRFLIEQLQKELEYVYLDDDSTGIPANKPVSSYAYVPANEPSAPSRVDREFPVHRTDLHHKSVFSRSRFVTYEANGNELWAIVSRWTSKHTSWLPEQRAHEKLWAIYVRFLPRQLLRDVSYFTVFDGHEHLGIAQWNDSIYDGRELGFHKEGIDMLDTSDERALVTTAIHEIGHLLTVGPEQMYLLEEDETCETLLLFRRCLRRWSVAYKFFDRFWSHGRQKSTSFVSTYASESLQEDLAETFLAFVVRDYPTSDSGADDKIRFLYQFDELVEVREEIRGELGYE